MDLPEGSPVLKRESTVTSTVSLEKHDEEKTGVRVEELLEDDTSDIAVEVIKKAEDVAVQVRSDKEVHLESWTECFFQC